MGWKTAAFGLSGYNAEKGARGGGMSLGDPVYPEQKTFYEYFRPGSTENPGWVGITSPIQSKVTSKSNVPVYPEATMGGGSSGGSGLGQMLGSLGGAALGTVLMPGVGTAAGAALGGELGGMAEGGDFNLGRAGMNFGIGMLTGGVGGAAKSAAPSMASQGFTELSGPAVDLSALGGPAVANTGRAGLRDAFVGMGSGGSAMYSPDANLSFGATNGAGGYMTDVRNRASGLWNGGMYGVDAGQMAQYAWPSMQNSGAY